MFSSLFAVKLPTLKSTLPLAFVGFVALQSPLASGESTLQSAQKVYSVHVKTLLIVGGISRPTEDAESCYFYYSEDIGQENNLKF
jgi:hypothetical protein